MGEKGSPRQKRRISLISSIHYVKLVYRSALLLAAAGEYIYARMNAREMNAVLRSPVLQWVIWCIFALEMFLRFFPSRMESMGCQKQFAHNYRPTGKHIATVPKDHSRFWVGVSWIALNALIAAMYFAGWIDKGILILIALAYSVCDMICILFFCPFQTWFMKNKCCGTCRIYNWDYAMMFTPLLFVGGVWSWSLLALSIGLLLRWEIAYVLHPEYFYEETNCSLSCAQCREKLCHHKRSLQGFLKKRAEQLGHVWKTKN